MEGGEYLKVCLQGEIVFDSFLLNASLMFGVQARLGRSASCCKELGLEEVLDVGVGY